MSANPLWDLQPELRENGVVSSLRARWSVVAERTIYFGHQSVGMGIVSGVEQLSEELALPLRVVETREPEAVTGPAFVHFLAGQNRDYASKNAAFLRLLESPTRAERPVALLKYCYVDIDSSAGAAAMFEAYRDTVETIRFEHPDVTVVHATIPLTTVESALKAGARKVLGRQTRRDAAVGRHRYNELVRAEYTGIEPIFDLAKVEATRPDGSHAGFTNGRNIIETLAPENTSDGGHLNPRCERATAEALLDVLASASASTP